MSAPPAKTLENVGPSAPPATRAAAPAKRFFAQAGAFQDPDNARRFAEQISAAGISDVKVQAAGSGPRTVHRVRVGPLASVAAYDAVVERLRAAGFGAVILAFD